MTHLPESLCELPTPSVLVELPRLERNIRQMQDTCTRHQTRLRPHIKTHKSVAIARRQLEAGAEGLTVAKIGEAEAMLPSGVRRIFVAHSLVDPVVIPRLQALAGQLDELVLAVTSEPHADALQQPADPGGPRTPGVDGGRYRSRAGGTALGPKSRRLGGPYRRFPALSNWPGSIPTKVSSTGPRRRPCRHGRPKCTPG